mgnify:CR=1 FL=1
MKIELYKCDICECLNEDQQEFRNEAIFVTDGETRENYRICLGCMQKFSNFIITLKSNAKM